MDFEDSLSALDIRQADINLPVKPAGTQQSIIQNIGTVGSCHDDDAFVIAETVHLHKELIESLLTLIMSAAEAGTSLTANRIDLIDEDNGRSNLLGLLKQISHAPGTDAHIKLHKIRTGDGEELHIRLSCHSLRQEGLTGSRRAHKKNSLGDSGAHLGVALRILQKVNHFCKLCFFLITSGHVLEGFLVLLVRAEFGAGFAETGKPASSAATGAIHHEIPQGHCPEHDHEIRHKACPPGQCKALGVVILFNGSCLVLFQDQIMKILIEDGKAVQIVGFFLCGIHGVIGADLQKNSVAFGLEGLDLLLLKEINQLGVGIQ